MPRTSNYKSMAKANALLGSVQIYQIVISIIRSKLVAVLLGAEGMGIMGLLNSTIDLVKSATNCGLAVSGVRDVSIAKGSGDKEKVSIVYTVLSKLVWITGLVGTLVVFVFAKQLSYLTFSNDDYSWAFRVLSIVLLVSQLNVVNQVMLQGLRALKWLSMNNIISSTLSLLIVIPLYFLYGFRAIVPSIIITCLLSFLVSSYYLYKLHLQKIDMSLSNALRQGSQMVILGFMLSFTGLMDVAQTYIVKIFIAQNGSVADVGLYNAGFAMITGYVGLVFSTVGTDFFPRLSSVCSDTEKYNDVINDQMEIMLLVLLPLVCVFVAFSELIIRLLYTEEFLHIQMMVSIMAVGMILRAVSWCMGFLFIAKGDKKLYLLIYIITFILTTTSYLGLYYIWRLIGIGITFFLLYFFSSISTFWIVRFFYNYKLRKETFSIIIIAVSLSILTLCLSFLRNMMSWLIIGCFILLSIIYSYRELNKRLDLVLFVKNYLMNKK